MLLFEKEDNYENKKKHMLESAEKAHDLAVSGELDIGVITKEIMEIAPEAQRYDAVELMLDVCVGDQDIKKVENDTIEKAVKLMGLEWSRYKVMREKRLADVEKIEESEQLDEGIFGIDTTMSDEEKCQQLRKSYNEFKALSVHNDSNKRKQALNMIERIKGLRKKYKC